MSSMGCANNLTVNVQNGVICFSHLLWDEFKDMHVYCLDRYQPYNLSDLFRADDNKEFFQHFSMKLLDGSLSASDFCRLKNSLELSSIRFSGSSATWTSTGYGSYKLMVTYNEDSTKLWSASICPVGNNLWNIANGFQTKKEVLDYLDKVYSAMMVFPNMYRRWSDEKLSELLTKICG